MLCNTIKNEYGIFELQYVVNLLEKLDNCVYKHNIIDIRLYNIDILQWFIDEGWAKLINIPYLNSDLYSYSGTQLLVEDFDNIIETLERLVI